MEYYKEKEKGIDWTCIRACGLLGLIIKCCGEGTIARRRP